MTTHQIPPDIPTIPELPEGARPTAPLGTTRTGQEIGAGQTPKPASAAGHPREQAKRLFPNRDFH